MQNVAQSSGQRVPVLDFPVGAMLRSEKTLIGAHILSP